MSGYEYSSPEQTYSYSSTSYASVPQYTQAQINQYYARYQCYPPQPYQLIPKYYAQSVSVVQPTYPTTGAMPAYEQSWQKSDGCSVQDPTRSAPPHDEDTLWRHRSLKSDRRSRSNSRTRTRTCDIQGCTSVANFTRLADLQRHKATVHGVGTPDFPCTVPRCTRVGDKGFTRRDHLVEHLRNFHHLDIPKRKPGERSANPLGLPHFG